MFMMPILLDAKVVVETGFGRGHSSRILLESLNQLKGKRYLCTFELEDITSDIPAGQYHKDYKEILYYLYPEPEKEYNVQWIIFDRFRASESAIGMIDYPPIDLLYLDSDHSYENVCEELEIFKFYLSKKAVILLDDATQNNELTDVYKAAHTWALAHDWKELLFTETRGFPPENIATNGKMVLVRNE